MDDAMPPASGMFAGLRRHVLGRAGEAYVAICAVLAAMTFFPGEPISWGFPALFVATLPVSPFAWVFSVYGGIVVFGFDEGLVPRLVMFVLWVALATGQMFALRWIIRSSISREPVAPSADRPE